MTRNAAGARSHRLRVPAVRARWTIAAATGFAALALAGCGSSSSTSKAGAASQCRPGTGLTRTANTANYTMVLDVNPSEAMYTPAQVTAQHPKTGEVMLSGQMAGTAGSGPSDSPTSTMMGATTTAMGGGAPSTPMTTSSMSMGQTTVPGMNDANVRHLEVHICSLSTGHVVQDARPTITVVDRSSGGMTDKMSVAVMEGIGAGVSDLHYGNNVTMPAGHPYVVTVHQNRDTATFHFTGPS